MFRLTRDGRSGEEVERAEGSTPAPAGGWPRAERLKPMSTTPEQPEKPRANADRVRIFDTTLRDGEQCPGATMTFEEKIEVADCLDAIGVDIIEAGFPVAFQQDLQA